jgi:hypothetical protein
MTAVALPCFIICEVGERHRAIGLEAFHLP